MIDKKIFENVLDYLNNIKEIKLSLSKHNLNLNGIIDNYDMLVDDLLTELFDEEISEIIMWWVYERDSNTSFIKHYNNNKPIDLSNKTKFYKFLININK